MSLTCHAYCCIPVGEVPPTAAIRTLPWTIIRRHASPTWLTAFLPGYLYGLLIGFPFAGELRSGTRAG